MKITICSDLHLDFNVDMLYEGFDDNDETLIIAGDLVEIRLLKGKKNLRRFEIENFLLSVATRFKQVIYVFGNHEHYNHTINYTHSNFRSILDNLGIENIHVLENTMLENEEVIFFGATLWTNCRNRNPISMNAIQAGMNDYSVIDVIDAYYHTRNLTTDDTCDLHDMSVMKLKKFIALETTKKKVLVTHHAPSYESIGDNYRASSLNDGYASDLVDLLYDSDIKLAVHGHIHDSVDYQCGGVRIVTNPRGYYGHETAAYSYTFKTVEV